MRKELEIAQVNELKFYLDWDYVKEICNEAMRKENEQLHKFLEEFNALEVVEENQQLKELLKECREMAFKIRLALSYGRINDVFDLTYQLENKIDNAIGEKK